MKRVVVHSVGYLIRLFFYKSNNNDGTFAWKKPLQTFPAFLDSNYRYITISAKTTSQFYEVSLIQFCCFVFNFLQPNLSDLMSWLTFSQLSASNSYAGFKICNFPGMWWSKKVSKWWKQLSVSIVMPYITLMSASIFLKFTVRGFPSSNGHFFVRCCNS